MLRIPSILRIKCILGMLLNLSTLRRRVKASRQDVSAHRSWKIQTPMSTPQLGARKYVNFNVSSMSEITLMQHPYEYAKGRARALRFNFLQFHITKQPPKKNVEIFNVACTTHTHTHTRARTHAHAHTHTRTHAHTHTLWGSTLCGSTGGLL